MLSRIYRHVVYRIVTQWDWMVYWLAYRSLKRICEREAGFALLFQLWLQDWLEKNPVSPELESATVHLFKSLRDASEKSQKGNAR